jgi:hypothetical protein
MDTLLKLQSSITVYLLPTKENKFRFPFPFAANIRKFAFSVFHLQKTNGSCPLPLFPFSVCGILEIWRHGNGAMETWKHGEIETWDDMETWKKRPGSIEIWKHGDINMET